MYAQLSGKHRFQSSLFEQNKRKKHWVSFGLFTVERNPESEKRGNDLDWKNHFSFDALVYFYSDAEQRNRRP